MSTNKPSMLILRGLQASGKTTFARAWVDEDRANRVRVNRDDLRQMVDGGVFVKGVTEGRILAARNALVKQLMMRGLSVVVDDTNLAQRNVRDLARMAHISAWDWDVLDFTDVPLATCIERDQARERSVGAHVITDTYNRYLRGRELPLPLPTADDLAPKPREEGKRYLPKPDTPKAILVDIDGTLALHGTRSPFDETRVHEDRPNESVVEAVWQEIENGFKPVFMSGRTEGCRAATVQWLKDNVLSNTSYWFDEPVLFMRPVGDGRPDSEVKLELFDRHVRDHYNVRRVYDDRDQVVRMWRSIGLTVLQVADGAF